MISEDGWDLKKYVIMTTIHLKTGVEPTAETSFVYLRQWAVPNIVLV